MRARPGLAMLCSLPRADFTTFIRQRTSNSGHYAEFSQRLIEQASTTMAAEPRGMDWTNTIYAFDAPPTSAFGISLRTIDKLVAISGILFSIFGAISLSLIHISEPTRRTPISY